MKTKVPKLTQQQKSQILGDTLHHQLPILNANDRQYQEWLDSAESRGIRLTGKQVTTLLDLFAAIEDAVTYASNTLV